MTIHRLCVFGVGGVGGFFGGKIAEAIKTQKDTRNDVYFIARGHHLKAIQNNGLKVITPEKTIVAVPTEAVDSVSDIPDPDLFLICVKGYDLSTAVKAIRPKVREDTIIMPLLNGADIYDRIRQHLDTGIVLPACVFVGTHIEHPGIIRQNGGDGKILFGRDPQFPEVYPGDIKSFFDGVGIRYQWMDDPFPGIWTKYIFIAAFGLITAYTGKTLGEILADHDSTELVRSIMKEILSIAEKKAIKLPKNIIQDSIDKAYGFPPETKTSYQRDVETKGNVNEGDLFGGTVIREGLALNVPTPVTKSVYRQIQQVTSSTERTTF